MAVDAGILSGKLPPQNLEAERGVLGSILLLSSSFDEVADLLKDDYFYHEPHKYMYGAIQKLYESGVRGIDAVTLAEELVKREQLELVGGATYIVDVLESVPHAAHAKYYAQIVRDKWIQRSLIYACTDILKGCYDPGSETADVLQEAESKIFNILKGQDGEQKLEIRDILMETFDRIQQRISSDSEVSGVSTGFTDLDEKTNGLQASEIIILAARPSMGKTAFVCNVAMNVAQMERKAVVFFSLEQSKLELAERLLAIHTRINGKSLRAGELTDEEHDRLMRGSSELSELPLYIDDQPGRTMAQIGAISRRISRQDDLGLIVIDYLQLVEPEDRNQPREQQIAQISRRLKFLSKDLAVPVVALAQLNRGVELREDKRPKLADLRESGSIEQDADLVMFLHRPDAYDPEERPGEAELIVAKHRSGPTGIVRLTWRKEFMRFDNFSHLSEPDDGYFATSTSTF